MKTTTPFGIDFPVSIESLGRATRLFAFMVCASLAACGGGDLETETEAETQADAGADPRSSEREQKLGPGCGVPTGGIVERYSSNDGRAEK